LLNPRYAALRSHVDAELLEKMHPTKARLAGIVGPAAWPAVVDEDTWRTAVALVTDPSRANPPRSGVALLTGIARCGVCDAPVHGGRTGPRTGNAKNYRCSASYGHFGRAQEPVDSYVRKVTLARLARQDVIERLAKDRPERAELAKEARKLRRKLDQLAEDYAEDAMTRQQFRIATRETRDKLAVLDEKIAAAGRGNALSRFVGVDDVAEVWAALDDVERREVISDLMEIRLLPPGRGVRTFRPETVDITWKDEP
jgi:site-specific DNA recombinase